MSSLNDSVFRIFDEIKKITTPMEVHRYELSYILMKLSVSKTFVYDTLFLIRKQAIP